MRVWTRVEGENCVLREKKKKRKNYFTRAIGKIYAIVRGERNGTNLESEMRVVAPRLARSRARGVGGAASAKSRRRKCETTPAATARCPTAAYARGTYVQRRRDT